MSSEIDYRRIGRHFRAARQQLNLKQKDVAELLGVSVKTYSNMERGAQELSLYRIIQLCQLLKLKPGCVLDDCNDDLLTLETLPETVCEAKAQLMLLSSKGYSADNATYQAKPGYCRYPASGSQYSFFYN